MTQRSINVVVVDGEESSLRALVQRLNSIDFVERIAECSSLKTARDQVLSGEFSLCVVGRHFDTGDRRGFIRALTLSRPGAVCAVCAVVADESDPDLLSIVRAGAHSVLFESSDDRRFKQAISAAVRALPTLITSATSAKEQITNLPWILESVAMQLEGVAQAIADHEANGERFEVSSESVKEALLTALAHSGPNSNELGASIVTRLRARSVHRNASSVQQILN